MSIPVVKNATLWELLEQAQDPLDAPPVTAFARRKKVDDTIALQERLLTAVKAARVVLLGTPTQKDEQKWAEAVMDLLPRIHDWLKGIKSKDAVEALSLLKQIKDFDKVRSVAKVESPAQLRKLSNRLKRVYKDVRKKIQSMPTTTPQQRKEKEVAKMHMESIKNFVKYMGEQRYMLSTGRERRLKFEDLYEEDIEDIGTDDEEDDDDEDMDVDDEGFVVDDDVVEYDDDMPKPQQPKSKAKAKKPTTFVGVLQRLMQLIRDPIWEERKEQALGVIAKYGNKSAKSKQEVKSFKEFAKFFTRLDMMLKHAMTKPQSLTQQQTKALRKGLQGARNYFGGSKKQKYKEFVALVDSAMELIPSVPGPKPVKQPKSDSGSGSDLEDIDKRTELVLRSVGATVEKGTCPLGAPPEGKRCVRGFWQKKQRR